MVLFKRSEHTPCQLDMALRTWGSVTEAIKDPRCCALSSDAPAMIILMKGKIQQLNYIAACIWEYLSEPRSSDDIVLHIADLFRAPILQVAEDVDAFLATLQGHGAVTSIERS